LNWSTKHTDLGRIQLQYDRARETHRAALAHTQGYLAEYIEHRKIIVTRRTKFDLRKAEERAHI